jgi:hypothetical protein
MFGGANAAWRLGEPGMTTKTRRTLRSAGSKKELGRLQLSEFANMVSSSAFAKGDNTQTKARCRFLCPTLPT